MVRIVSFVLFLLPFWGVEAQDAINRKKIVQSINPRRNASSEETPLQVGNGEFAFGVDITGLQTFKPFATMSTWGWHNFSLPSSPNQTSIEDFTGLNWWTETQDGLRLVNYNQPNPAENEISAWLIKNPQRINLGTIGFSFSDAETTEETLAGKSQELDLWSGKISSNFTYNGVPVRVETWANPLEDIVEIYIESKALGTGDLGLFVDFPYPNLEKFNAPFVGVFNETTKHLTGIHLSYAQPRAVIEHIMDSTVYYLDIRWHGNLSFVEPEDGSHRYQARVANDRLWLTVKFTPDNIVCASLECTAFKHITDTSRKWWEEYWMDAAFVDFSEVEDERAQELQRRVILSQYLTAVNCAGSDPPQESGLVNNGWYGKFHLEMYLWHALHWAHWSHWDLLQRSLHRTYSRFLSSSIDRAKAQSYDGARWGKMTDPTGRSAPGEINSLLIWQQPHPMYFAEVEYRSAPEASHTLESWDEIITATADFMASYPWLNKSTGYYSLGIPMYDVGENTNPNNTMNPTFELAYWRFGLDVAIQWKERQGLEAPEKWIEIRDNLSPLPVVDDTYPVYEGIPNMWVDNKTVEDHPAMSAIFGLLPPPISGPELNMTILKNTAAKILEMWDLDYSFGWDFPMLAMNSLRLGDTEQAIEYLLHPIFQFDDAGYPIGGTRVPTPYFPGSSSFLLAIAMFSGGWKGENGSQWPEKWGVRAEGFVPGL